MINATAVSLVSQTFTVNDAGDSIATDATRTVYAEVHSVGMKRKIEAEQIGLKIAFVFVLSNVAEYNGEEILEYEGVRYNIVNAYTTKEQRVELTTARF